MKLALGLANYQHKLMLAAGRDSGRLNTLSSLIDMFKMNQKLGDSLDSLFITGREVRKDAVSALATPGRDTHASSKFERIARLLSAADLTPLDGKIDMPLAFEVAQLDQFILWSAATACG